MHVTVARLRPLFHTPNQDKFAHLQINTAAVSNVLTGEQVRHSYLPFYFFCTGNL